MKMPVEGTNFGGDCAPTDNPVNPAAKAAIWININDGFMGLLILVTGILLDPMMPHIKVRSNQ